LGVYGWSSTSRKGVERCLLKMPSLFSTGTASPLCDKQADVQTQLATFSPLPRAPEQITGRDEPVLPSKHVAALPPPLQLAHHRNQLVCVRRGHAAALVEDVCRGFGWDGVVWSGFSGGDGSDTMDQIPGSQHQSIVKIAPRSQARSDHPPASSTSGGSSTCSSRNRPLKALESALRPA